jgi:hypothetical protein
MALLDLDRLAEAYVAELGEEGVSVDAPITVACVLADLFALAGLPVPPHITQALDTTAGLGL